jgi:hypothetical protein
MATVEGLEPKAGAAEAEADAGAEGSEPVFVWDRSVSWTLLGLGWDAEPVVLDWFGQGGPDLLVSAEGGPNGRVARVYRHRPATAEAPAHYDEGTEIPALAGLRLFCPLPNGSSSRFDLVALSAEGLVWLRNRGDTNRPVFERREPLGFPADLGLGPGRIAQMVAEDWDGDGRIDLILGFDDLTGYWPEGGAVPAEQQVGFNQRGVHPGYNASGTWRGRAPRGQIFWLRNVGEPGSPRFEGPEEIREELGRHDLGPRLAPLEITWSGRGVWEVLLADHRGLVRLFRNFGGQRPPVLMEPRLLRVGRAPLSLPEERTVLVAADLDADGRAELIFGTADGRVFAIHAGAGRDEVEPPAPLLQEGRTLRLGGRAVVAVGDLDADGDLDLVVGLASGRLLYLQDLGGPGEHRYAAPIELEAGGDPFRLDPGFDGVLAGPVAPRLGYACPALGDWSDHGRLDLIVSGAGGEVFVLRNNGAPTDPRFASAHRLHCQGGPLILPPRVRPALADWRGTGALDLIALNLQGFLCAYPKIRATEVGPPVPLVDRLGRWIRLDGGFGLAGRCALWAGDWTGSGRIDLLVGLPRDARFAIPALIGRSVSNLDELPTVLLLENAGRSEWIPRPLWHADGRPVVVGVEGCSPAGADVWGRGVVDLVVGADDGTIAGYRREDLRW